MFEAQLCSLAGALVLLGGLSTARAHISVDDGGTHMSRSGVDDQKDAPCGVAGSKRGTNVYKYKPGATITLSIAETISHPGYFRIAFDKDGDDNFPIPMGTDGMMGNCSGDPKCGPGKADYCSNETVLLDNLDPHAQAFGASKKYTWSVKLPDVECDNCTLQIIQMMNDFNFHPSPYPADDIYYRCIDIVLSNSAPDVTTTPVENKGMTCPGAQNPPAAGTGGTAGAGGVAAGTGAGGATAGTGAAGAVAGTGAVGAAAGTGAAAAGGAAAGAPAGAAGRASVAGSPGGGAGAAAAGTGATSSGTAGGAAGIGTNMMAMTQAGSIAPGGAPPAAASDDGGCSVASVGAGKAPASLALAWLGLAAVLASRPWRRRER
jgi:MYXO-CTERM domain-containing protein